MKTATRDSLLIALFIVACALVVTFVYHVGRAYTQGYEGTPRIQADISVLSAALRAYKDHTGTFPTTEQGLSALVEEPELDPKPASWVRTMKKIPKDPWGNPYQYRCPGKRNPSGFDVFSLAADRVESDDDVGNWN